MKLATIETIKSLSPIEGADRIELATVLGFQAVVKKGEFQVNDKIVFIQPDTVLPDAEWAKTYKAKSNLKQSKSIQNNLKIPSLVSNCPTFESQIR